MPKVCRTRVEEEAATALAARAHTPLPLHTRHRPRRMADYQQRSPYLTFPCSDLSRENTVRGWVGWEHEQVEMGGTRSVARGVGVDGVGVTAQEALQSNASQKRDKSARL